jgi:ubiquitin-protein ligase
MSAKRISKEYRDIISKPPMNVSAGIVDNDINHWEAIIIGPEGTPYANGTFKLDIIFPLDYPFTPPKILFKTKIYHCNIDAHGHICLDILKDSWSAALTIEKVLLSICSLLNEPNPHDPLVPAISQQYIKNKVQYDITAREFTLKFAY